MSTRGITLVRGTFVTLDLDGTLVYVEDVQPTGARVVALPEQPAERKDNAVFTPGRVGAKVISPYSSAARVVPVTELSDRNKDFAGTFEALRKQHGPNYVQRTAAEQAAEEAKVSVTKVHPTRAPRGSVTPEDKKNRRAQRKAAKVPCTKCGMLPVHANHHGGGCEYEAPEKKGRGRKAADPAPSASKGGGSFKVVNADISTLQADNDKFAQGNRFFRVFKALEGLPESTGTLAQIMQAVFTDNGKPMTNPEKVCRRALKALRDSGNVEAV